MLREENVRVGDTHMNSEERKNIWWREGTMSERERKMKSWWRWYFLCVVLSGVIIFGEIINLRKIFFFFYVMLKFLLIIILKIVYLLLWEFIPIYFIWIFNKSTLWYLSLTFFKYYFKYTMTLTTPTWK